MQELSRIYFDMMDNLFSLLLFYAITKETLQITPAKKKVYVAVFLHILYSIPESIPYNDILSYVFPFVTAFLLCYPNWKTSFIVYIKHTVISVVGLLLISVLHFLILDDNALYNESLYYNRCKGLLCIAFVYICYILFVYSKRMRLMNRYYPYLFSGIILCISITLSYLTLFICQTSVLDTPIIPILLSALFLLIVACIEIYKQFICILEENMQMQIQLEKAKLTAEYSGQIDKRLKELHSLRHDMRNHFLTIDGYATQKRPDSIRQYISQISEKL